MKYALHETLEVQEIASFKTVSLTKTNTMLLVASDTELQDILRLDVQLSTNALKELNEILKKADQQEMTI